MNRKQVKLLKMMADRLERLNVDSKWARRASGLRGAVIRAIEQIQLGKIPSQDEVDHLIGRSMDILAKAAKDIPDSDISKEKQPQES